MSPAGEEPEEFGEHLDFILLAGGSSRRLGRDKAFVDVAGRTLLERVLSVAGDPMFDRRVLVTNDSTDFRRPLRRAGWDVEKNPRPVKGPNRWLKMVPDRRPGRGPLAGIEAGMEEAVATWCFVAACDLPFLTPRLPRLLRNHVDPRSGSKGVSRPEAVIPVHGGNDQPLCALYRRSVGMVASSCLDEDVGSVEEFLRGLHVRRVASDRLDLDHSAERVFFNVNTPGDLERARRMAAAMPG